MHYSHFAAVLFSASAVNAWWKPANGTTWQIILSEVLDPNNLPNVQAIDGDLFDNSKANWATIKSKGYQTICYFSTQYEEWRPDAQLFRSQPQNLGANLDDWAGERWVNTRADGIRSIMKSRIKEAKNRGCDAIDPDNIDAYLHNGGGFNLTQDDAVNYIRFLAAEAHALDLAIGLKNGDDIVSRVIDVVDFEVNEQCQQYNECQKYRPFVAKGKPVFEIEYVTGTPSAAKIKSVCQNTTAKGFSTVIKHMSLDKWVVDCSKQGGSGTRHS